MGSLFLKRFLIALCVAMLLIFSCIVVPSITYAHQTVPTSSAQLGSHYRGSFLGLSGTLPLQIDFSSVVPQALAGRVTIYQQSGSQLTTGPISNGSINGTTVQFTMNSDIGADFVIVFSGALASDGSLSGTWTDIAIVPTSPTGTWNATNTSTTPAATVDLQTLDIHSLQPLLAGSNPTLRADIRNNGSAASGNFNIRWIADGNIADGGHFSIPGGAVDTHDYIWHNITAGQHTITFIANFDHSIAETDYSNNQFTLTFTASSIPPPPTPTQNNFSGAWIVPNNGFTFTYNTVHLSATASGPIDHVNFTGFWQNTWHTLQKVQYQSNGIYAFDWNGLDVNGALANGNVTLSFDGYSKTTHKNSLGGFRSGTVSLVPYYQQYANQPTQNIDCGAATVAMTLGKYNRGPGGSGTALTQIRAKSQTPANSDMLDSNIETALSFYQAHYQTIARGMATQSEIQQIEAATSLGRPVIVLVHGAQLGRTEEYKDHWIVITGFSPDNTTVYVNDPDLRSPAQLKNLPAGWINGGQISLSMATFQAAFANVLPLNQTQVSVVVTN